MLGIRTAPPPAGRLAARHAPGPCSIALPERLRGDRDETLAVVAHELRGPLAAILYALEAMTDGNPVTRRVRAIVERQARRAARIVDDLFDVCAGSRDRLSLRPEVVDVAEIVAGASQSADPLLARRGHQLTISLPPERLLVSVDVCRLEQVLANLLANAAKFTAPGGHVRLTVERDGGQVVIRVRDDGQGIAPHFLPRVFDPFAQGGDRDGLHAEGLGLGLALVKALVERHGGCVAAFSDGPGRGAEFVVRLPAHGGGERRGCPPTISLLSEPVPTTLETRP